jgi:hypothetical protein
MDASGLILNDAHTDQIRPPFRALVDDVVQAYTRHISADIDSIYITGSVARGLAVEGLSDLNAVAVLAARVDPDLVLQDWIPTAEAALRAQHPCVTDVQLELWPYYSVFTDPARFAVAAFVLKTHSACVWGVDLSSQLPDYRITPAIANDDLVQLADDLADARAALQADPDETTVRIWTRFAAKCILRAGFGLVQMQEGVHTRDADLCYHYCARHYPGHADDLRRALSYVDQPPSRADQALTFLDTVGAWMIARADAWLDDHNPTRELALPVDDIEEAD